MFCLQPKKVMNELKELRMLCADDEQSRTCWMTAFRLLKVGNGMIQLDDLESSPFPLSDLEPATFSWPI